MKARIKGNTEWDDFDPIFNRDGFQGFIRSKWVEENKDKDEYGLFPPNYPLEMMEFPLDNERRWEDIRVNASIAAMAKLMPDHLYDNQTHYVCEYDEKVRKQQIVVAAKAVGYANALVDELKRTAVKDESDENHCLTK